MQEQLFWAHVGGGGEGVAGPRIAGKRWQELVLPERPARLLEWKVFCFFNLSAPCLRFILCLLTSSCFCLR